MSGLSRFFDEVVNFNLYTAVIGAALAAILLACVVNLLLFSNLARLCRAGKATEKFFKTNSHINKYNRALFNRRVIKLLPRKPRKAWIESAVFYQNYSSEAFENAVRNASKHGGNSTFVFYVFSYIAALILILVGLIAVGGEDYYAALAACSGIFGGAVGLLVLAIELYYLDKRAERKALAMISELKSRALKKNGDSLELDSAKQSETRRKESFLDAVHKLYSRETQAAALGSNGSVNDMDVPQLTACEQEPAVKCLEHKSADDFDRLYSEQEETRAEEGVIATHDDITCVNVEGLIKYEQALSKGANAICATGINSAKGADYNDGDATAAGNDKIAELEKLINALIVERSSELLLSEVYDVISELAEYNFTSSVELARIKILLKRLKTAI